MSSLSSRACLLFRGIFGELAEFWPLFVKPLLNPLPLGIKHGGQTQRGQNFLLLLWQRQRTLISLNPWVHLMPAPLPRPTP